MARPRGRQKTSRLTVNLDDQAYGALLAIASNRDAPLSWVVRRAVSEFIQRELPAIEEPALPLTRSVPGHRSPAP